MVASIGCSLFWGRFAVSKPLSQIQRSTLLLLQKASHMPSFGGFGLRDELARLADFDLSDVVPILAHHRATLPVKDSSSCARPVHGVGRTPVRHGRDGTVC